MKRPVSAYAKAFAGSFTAAGFALGGVNTDGAVTWQELLFVGIAFVGGLFGVGVTRNTETQETGIGAEPVVRQLVDADGTHLGELTADTGEAVGGIVAGTTGQLGGMLDATLGRLLPKR